MAINKEMEVTRPTYVEIDYKALLNNLTVVQKHAPQQQVIAMVKANAYGCGVEKVVSCLRDKVYAFGVAFLEEALVVLEQDKFLRCIVFEGVFSLDELKVAYESRVQLVIHQQRQLDWILQNPVSHSVKVWVKVDTGMHRLGF